MFGIEQEVSDKVLRISLEMRSRAERGSEILRNHAVEVLSRGGGGRQYKKAYRSSTHTASAPGETPAPLSGRLRGSWRTIPNVHGGTANVGIDTHLNYAEFLEHGTSKMAARPYVDKIKQAALPDIKALFNQPYSV